MSHDQAEPVDALVADLLDACHGGRRSDCAVIVKEHPEYGSELSAFVDDYEKIAQKFAPLRDLSGGTPFSAAEMPTLATGDTAAELPKVGGSFGDYDLLSEIARGGMGVVYKARQKSLNRVVALKMVLGGRRDPNANRDRFLVEARAVARLNHSHIVPIYEVSEHRGQPYFTMEFFSGGSLRDRIDTLRGDQQAVARMMVSVARAIEHAHRRGILHRDIKPTNVLLDERGEPHVTDFGLAKRLDEESELTQAGAIVGTPSYMAPEQAQADNDLTTAVDVYGLGALMYELLTGRPPFKGNTPLETMMSVMAADPAPPRKLHAGVDIDLETICLKCLEKLPKDRYPSADALADDLQRWLDGEPILARPASALERLVKWSRRQPVLAGSLTAVAAAGIGLLILAGFLWRNAEARAQAVKNLGEAEAKLAQVDGERQQAEARKSEAEKLADEQRAVAEKQKGLADKIEAKVGQLQKAADEAQKRLATAERDARHTLYAADVQLAHVAWQSGNVGATHELLQKYVPERNAAADDPRGFEWHYLWRQTHAARRSFRPETPASASFSPVHGIAVSPDGKMLATAGSSGQGQFIRLWNLADGKLVRTIQVGGTKLEDPSFKLGDLAITNLAFSDEGRRVVVTHRKPLNYGLMDKWIGDLAKNKAPFSPKQLQESFEFRSWSVSDDSPVRIEPFDATRLDGAVYPVFAGITFAVHEGKAFAAMSLVRSPDRRYLAIGGMNLALPSEKLPPEQQIRGGSVLVFDLEKSQVVARRDGAEMVTSVGFAPESKVLAVGYSSGGIDLFPPDLSQRTRRITAHPGSVNALEFTADGSLLSGGRDGQIHQWNVASGEQAARFRGHTAAVTRITLPPNGQSIVSAGLDGEVKLWDAGGTSETRVLLGHTKQVAALAFSPDGRELHSMDLGGRLKGWHVADGMPTRDQQSASGAIFQANFSPRATLVAWPLRAKGEIAVRNITSGKEQRLTWKDRNPFSVAISPDDRWLATSDLSRGEIALWNLADGQLLRTMSHGKSMPQGLVFSPSGKQLAAIHANISGLAPTLFLWDCETGEKRAVLEMKSASSTAAFSPDESLMAVSETGNSVRVWNLRENRLQAEIRGAGLNVGRLIFTPDNRRLASAGVTSSEQGLLKLWDTTNGRELFSAALPPRMITALALSPDGHRLAAALASNDGFDVTGKFSPEIHIWDATPIEQAAAANDRPLQGTWIVVSAELNGQNSQSSAGDKFTFDGDKVTIENKVKKSEPVTYRNDATKSPAEIDIEDKSDTRGIYELKDGTLTICYGQQRPTGFDSRQGLLLKLRREPVKP